MRPSVRRAALVAHVGTSVGWLGAVAASLGLAVVGLAASDSDVVRAAYLVLEPMGWTILVPLSVASLVTGIIQAVGTTWGLLRHYWVVIKLAMNLFATGVLLLYMQTLAMLADTARAAPTGDVTALRTASPIAHSAAAIGLLLVALALSVYKPRGMLRWARR